MSEKENNFLPYLREERLPHLFCPGCGNGAVMNAFLKAMEKAKIDFNNIAMVSGIGCSSRIPGYVNCDSLHTTHGRAITFATGLKIANKDLDVIVFTGDGDAAAIGGNHLIHAARRNINLTVICINNKIYGMTGGQISPTSPKGTFATTAPYGSQDNPFKLAELVATSGATYSARWTTVEIDNLVLSIEKGLKNPGFSFIEVVTLCPTYYGRKNKLKTPLDMVNVIKKNTVFKSAADRMRSKDLDGKIIVGEFADKQQIEFTDLIEDISIKTFGQKTVRNSAYDNEFLGD